MKLGLALPQLGAPSGADQIASLARTSEQLAYASLWVGDRVLAGWTALEPLFAEPRRKRGSLAVSLCAEGATVHL